MSLANALALAEKGFHVFPVQAGGKLPAIEGFPETATRDPKVLRRLFYCDVMEHDHGYNVGIYCGRFGDDPADSLCVIDVDNKDGKSGTSTLAQLVAAGLPAPRTYTQHTPTGGKHFVYRTRTAVANSAGKLGEGLDIRGTGGFIVAAGSAVEAGTYSADAGPVAEAPAALIALCAAYVPKAAAGGSHAAPAEIDPVAAERIAIAYLRSAPLAAQGQGGDATAFAVCAKVKDYGVSEAAMLPLLMEHWNDRCAPPWDAGELAEKIANAFAYGRKPPGCAAADALFQPASSIGPTKLSRLVLTRADSITPEAIRWLWDGWLAAGKFHILAGAPGTGKTTLALALAAVVTTGGRWPDGSHCERGRVLIWSGEDSPADTLVPRLFASGADCSRVDFIEGRTDGVTQRSFDPAHDAPLLAEALAANDVRLLIVDPIVSAVAGDSHKNAEVRRALQPLTDVAAMHGCAVLGISHFSKGTQGRDPTERVTGSLAFSAMPRVVMVAAKRTDNAGNDSRLFARSKSNIGPDDGGFSYGIEQRPLPSHPGVTASAVVWQGAVEGEARELLAVAEEEQGSGTGSALGDAKEFLVDLLANGPIRQGDVLKLGKAEGFTDKTVRNAKDALGVESKKDGMKGPWLWKLPEGAPQKAKMPNTESGAPSGNEGRLRGEGTSCGSDLFN